MTRERLQALCRDLIRSGDMTLVGERMLLKVWDDTEGNPT